MATYKNSFQIVRHSFTSTRINLKISKHEILKKDSNVPEDLIIKMIKETL